MILVQFVVLANVFMSFRMHVKEQLVPFLIHQVLILSVINF